MKPDLKTILYIGTAVLLTLQIKSCFDGRKKDEVWKVKLDAIEEDKKELKIENVSLTSERDSLIAISRSQDNDFKNQTSKIEYRNKIIPVLINAMHDDDINRAIEKRFGHDQ